MIEKFLNEINNNKSFNANLKETINVVKVGCALIYLTFIISILLYPNSITITLWITLASWFFLVMFSAGHLINEKYDFDVIRDKNSQINKDILLVKDMLKKYKLEDNVDDIINYISKDKKENNVINYLNEFTIVFPLVLVILLIVNFMDFKVKMIYIIIIGLLTFFMNKFVNFLSHGYIYDKKKSNYQHIIVCLNTMDVLKLK